MRELKIINKNIYYIDGEEKTDRPLLALIKGEEKSLMIDTGNSKEHLNVLLDLLKKNNIPKPDFAVITHWHWDHSFAISAADFPVISSELTYEELKKQKNFRWDKKSLLKRVEAGIEAEFCAEKIIEEYLDPKNVDIELPDITFSDKLIIFMGGLKAEIINLGSEHSDDSTIIWVEEEKTLFLGDIMAPDLYRASWNYHLQDLKKLYQKVKSYPAEYYIESHLEPQKREEFLKSYAEIIEIGEKMEENNYDLSLFKANYITEKNKEKAEEILEIAEMFLEGKKVKLDYNKRNFKSSDIEIESNRLILRPLSKDILIDYILNGQKTNIKTEERVEITEKMKNVYKIKYNNIKRDPYNILFYTYWEIYKKEDGDIIGYIGFKDSPDLKEALEIGYGTEERFRNKGFMTEALKALTEWIFDNYKDNVKIIKAYTSKTNEPSIRILEKNNFKHIKEENNLLLWIKLRDMSPEEMLNDYKKITDLKQNKIEAWHFCNNKKDANKLAELVIKGIKKATASALWYYEVKDEKIPEAGDLNIITDWDGNARCIIKTTNVEIVPYNKVSEDFARREGEGDKSLDYWREAHEKFFKEDMKEIGKEFKEDIPVVCEDFEVVFSYEHNL